MARPGPYRSRSRISRTCLCFCCILLLRVALPTPVDVVDVEFDMPATSDELISSFTCMGGGRSKLPNQLDVNGDSFFQYVLAGRHTTWTAGWELPVGPTGVKQYARVYDMLNWAREQNSQPDLIDIASICHKGMERDHNNTSSTEELSRQPDVVTGDSWAGLMSECRGKLYSAEDRPTGIAMRSRAGETCIDIPGLVVKSSNPCDLEYRMVDGAHRMCLRKLLLVLLSGELHSLEDSLEVQVSNGMGQSAVALEMKVAIDRKARQIRKYKSGFYIVIEELAFNNLVTDDDPHQTWARSNEDLWNSMTAEIRSDWTKWMSRIMERIKDHNEPHEHKNKYNGPHEDL